MYMSFQRSDTHQFYKFVGGILAITMIFRDFLTQETKKTPVKLLTTSPPVSLPPVCRPCNIPTLTARKLRCLVRYHAARKANRNPRQLINGNQEIGAVQLPVERL